jgi:hypothetical protein
MCGYAVSAGGYAIRKATADWRRRVAPQGPDVSAPDTHAPHRADRRGRAGDRACRRMHIIAAGRAQAASLHRADAARTARTRTNAPARAGARTDAAPAADTGARACTLARPRRQHRARLVVHTQHHAYGALRRFRGGGPARHLRRTLHRPGSGARVPDDRSGLRDRQHPGDPGRPDAQRRPRDLLRDRILRPQQPRSRTAHGRRGTRRGQPQRDAPLDADACR